MTMIPEVQRLEFQLAVLQQDYAVQQQELLKLREAVARTTLENVQLNREVTKNAIQQASTRVQTLAQAIQQDHGVKNLDTDVDWTTGEIRGVQPKSSAPPAGPDHPGA
jgi:regulator of replication initiation timing